MSLIRARTREQSPTSAIFAERGPKKFSKKLPRYRAPALRHPWLRPTLSRSLAGPSMAPQNQKEASRPIELAHRDTLRPAKSRNPSPYAPSLRSTRTAEAEGAFGAKPNVPPERAVPPMDSPALAVGQPGQGLMACPGARERGSLHPRQGCATPPSAPLRAPLTRLPLHNKPMLAEAAGRECHGKAREDSWRPDQGIVLDPPRPRTANATARSHLVGPRSLHPILALPG